MVDMRQELSFTAEQSQKIAKEYPDFLNGLVAFDKAGMSEGALSKKTKELIAVSLAVIKQCTYCISWHVKACLQEGASPDEIMEASFVACVLGGGPAWMYTKLVHKAIEEFSDIQKKPGV